MDDRDWFSKLDRFFQGHPVRASENTLRRNRCLRKQGSKEFDEGLWSFSELERDAPRIFQGQSRFYRASRWWFLFQEMTAVFGTGSVICHAKSREITRTEITTKDASRWQVEDWAFEHLSRPRYKTHNAKQSWPCGASFASASSTVSFWEILTTPIVDTGMHMQMYFLSRSHFSSTSIHT